MKLKLPEIILSSDPSKREHQMAGRLYFWGAALPVIVVVFQVSAQSDHFPSIPKMVAAILAGLSAGLVSLKAYQDNSGSSINPPSINSPISGSNG